MCISYHRERLSWEVDANALLPSTFRTVYCDETADESSGINVHQPTAFAHKLLQLSGVSLFWDEFSASAKSSPVCSTAPVVGKTKQKNQC